MENPATPVAPATAIPGTVPAGNNPPPAAVPPLTAQVPDQEGKVTIPLKEYRNLQRGAARALSFDKRLALNKPGANLPTNASGDPDVDAIRAEADNRVAEAERRALQLEVRGKVADLLGKDEFKALPKSTRELILKNPAMLSQADNIEEAMIDIEEFVRDQVLSMGDGGSNSGGSTPPQNQPPRTETPPTVSGGAPAPSDAAGLEDLSKLHGPAKSQAAIRNLMKTKGRGA